MIEIADLLRNDVLAKDYVSSRERLQPKVNLYEAKQRAVYIELCRRWLPEELKPVFDDLVRTSI